MLVHAAVMFLTCLLSTHCCKVSRSYSHSAAESSYEAENRVSEDRILNYVLFVEKLRQPCNPQTHVTRSGPGPAQQDRADSTLSTQERVNSINPVSRGARTLQRASSSSSASSISRAERETPESVGGVEMTQLRTMVAGIRHLLTEHKLQVTSCCLQSIPVCPNVSC